MIILLDIDGVMVPEKSWIMPSILEDGFPEFSSKAVGALKRFISPDTTIILTTSHKSKYSIGEWKNIFTKRGLQIDRLKKLDDNIENLNRKDEITKWFENNNSEENFIIIDDDKSLNELPDKLKKYWISTNSMIGLV